MKPMREDSAWARQNGKYCEYHHDYGHSMGNCKNLARVIIEVSEEEESKKLFGPPRSY